MLALPGCCQVSTQFLDAVEAATDAIGPEYSAYVAADLKLDAGQKSSRERTLALLRQAIDAARGKKVTP